MSSSEERMLILKMLEEKKITSEEAARLLEALGGNTKQAAGEDAPRGSSRPPRGERQPNFQDEVNKMRDKIHEWKKDFKGNYNANDFDRAVEEFTTKAEKLAKNVAVATFGIVDKMVDHVGSFVDTNAFNMFGSYKVEDRSFDTDAAEGMDLEVEGINGAIVVKKHEDHKIVIKSKVRSQSDNADDILKFDVSGNTVSMKLNKSGNISVAHEILIPAVKFGNIKLQTSNAKIYVEDSISGYFESTTRNGQIELMGVNSDKTRISTKNARIHVSYVTGKDIEIDTNNSLIDVKHIKTEALKAITRNGRILIENVQNLESAAELVMELNTTNGGIKVNMNDMDNRGYNVKARTTNGGVNLLIPDLSYNNINRQSVGACFAEAESSGYAAYPQKVSIQAETINGFIEIVK